MPPQPEPHQERDEDDPAADPEEATQEAGSRSDHGEPGGSDRFWLVHGVTR